jgi:hypothetical protein
MCKLLTVAVLVAAFTSIGGVASAEEGTGTGAPTLAQPRPSWYTEELEAQVLAAGREGVEVALSKQQQLELNCLGTSPPSVSTSGISATAVSAGGCMIAPHGCTMNFVFTDGSSKYIGTAGHCVQGGRTVVMQVATRVSPVDSTLLVTLAAIGKVARSWNAGIGKDFALVKIDPGWAVVAGVGGALGPTGAFCGDPLGQPVFHYGHGYIFFVEQGYPKFGEVIPDVSLIFKPSAEGFNARDRRPRRPGAWAELRHNDAGDLQPDRAELLARDGGRPRCQVHGRPDRNLIKNRAPARRYALPAGAKPSPSSSVRQQRKGRTRDRHTRGSPPRVQRRPPGPATSLTIPSELLEWVWSTSSKSKRSRRAETRRSQRSPSS